jgi:hypothetical protein
LALDLGPEGTVYFVGVVATMRAEIDYRVQPQELHLAFSFKGSQWQRINLSELPSATRPNLLARTTTYLDDRAPFASSLVTLQMKAKLDSSATLWEAFRTIPRQ